MKKSEHELPEYRKVVSLIPGGTLQFLDLGFDISKLAFLKFANATDFHKSASDYVGSYLSYSNNIIYPDQNIHRDKGFTIQYEPTFQSCDFLLEG